MSKLHLITWVIVTTAMTLATNIEGSHEKNNFTLITRKDWKAKPLKHTVALKTPVSYVTIHQSPNRPACNTLKECSQAMREIQQIEIKRKSDILYNFAVDGDGHAYKGRGWKTMSHPDSYFNTVSISITFIGDWTRCTPPPAQLEIAKALIAEGVKHGHIKPDYRVVSHNQIDGANCPGEALIKEIKTWHHYSNFPATLKDLLDIPEVPKREKDKIRNTTSSFVLGYWNEYIDME